MSLACKTLVRTSLYSVSFGLRRNTPTFSSFSPTAATTTTVGFSPKQGLRLVRSTATYASIEFDDGAPSLSVEDDEALTLITQNLEEVPENPAKDNVAHLLTHSDDVASLMKMERRRLGEERQSASGKWFPYLDRYKCGGSSSYLSSEELLEALDSHILDARKQRFKDVVRNRSYSVCLVVEGLSDFGNVSAAFRSADALGFQSVHVVSCDSSKRYRENRHVSMGAEKWLDIELWDSPQDCFQVLKSRGYRIATTHVGMDAVSIYEMDWSCPTAIVVGNENRGISDEALELSDFHCSIPMKGMVDSFNVSVAAGILMHHAVCDRTSRLGFHGDLTSEERQILLAEFFLRHSKSSISIAHEFAKRKGAMLTPKF
ncbi:uncharacterized protein LOC107415901 [Ziziphus jujuba]|uniref:Uncharacterized protein LOC107415901 n=1 Tax=Ziziphus jujuba TaxID=326968 RepID=A0A6P3ZLC1_ZIZJJ|nr:uncharacterized protein LOC107415901 [Ziziphus jujuba]